MDYEAITVKGLSKTYKVYRKPVDRLKGLLFKSAPSELFTALRDVTFSVNKGETLGIIGENGAGKSTLLKIISGVLTPSSGALDVNGKVLSILELGTGFHPEFTGRENIFFYGDILGFQRAFVNERIEGIIAFSELGDFIDKPVKTYSSGMFMRLAFSIVTSFQPEILILDEVLAVGDIHFQRKSLNRIMEFKKGGGTILFCSHDTYHIRMVCDRSIWLKDGKIEMIGNAEPVVLAYESYQFKKDESQAEQPAPAAQNMLPVMIESLDLLVDKDLKTGGSLAVRAVTRAQREDAMYHMTLSLKLPDGRGVYVTGTHLNGMGALSGGRTVEISFNNLRLLSGNYYIHLRTFDETGILCYHERATGFFNVGKVGGDMGICQLENEWKITNG